MNKTTSSGEPGAEKPERPVRKSLDQGIVPKDGWWFPAFVPTWARALPREMYRSVFTAYSTKWEVEHAIRQVKRKPGRPRTTDETQDGQFVLQVIVEQMKMHEEGIRVTETGALRRLTGKKNVELERARLNRARRELKAQGLID